MALPRDGRRQTIRVYLPPDYESSGRDYPVIYMFDGHNLFDVATSRWAKEWGIDETMERRHGKVPSSTVIVVGMDAPWEAQGRYAEYTIAEGVAHAEPGGDSSEADRQVHGHGARTAEFLISDG
ncbi:MAG: hypothetical protein QG597_4781, partial [Actinomycetota bacterium]|nr:hypothetical protein [Actinomycetota bacterium]